MNETRVRGDNNLHSQCITINIKHSFAVGENVGLPFDLNDPHEEDQQNMNAGNYFPDVQVKFATIIIHVKRFDNKFTNN